MTAADVGIEGVRLLPRTRHEDDRGWFMEILREEEVGVGFVQANHSRSRRGVLRGLHYHACQADVWYVVAGRARVGLADLRALGHPKVAVLELSGDKPAALYLPPGVAHGFYAVTDLDLVYLVTHYFDGADEFGVPWDDPALGVPWDVTDPILSERDRTVPPLDWDEVAAALGQR